LSSSFCDFFDNSFLKSDETDFGLGGAIESVFGMGYEVAD